MIQSHREFEGEGFEKNKTIFTYEAVTKHISSHRYLKMIFLASLLQMSDRQKKDLK